MAEISFHFTKSQPTTMPFTILQKKYLTKLFILIAEKKIFSQILRKTINELTRTTRTKKMPML